MRKIGNCYIEITSKCNLSCKHCYNQSPKNPNEEISYKAICSLVDNLFISNAKSITLSGGEPLLHKNFLKILDYITKRGLNATIVTNGTLINTKFIEYIKKYSLLTLQISLDGATAETNDIVRGHGSFNKTIHNIDQLKKSGIKKIFVKMVVSAYNKEDIKAFYNLISYYDYLPIFGLLERQGNASGKQDMFIQNVDDLYKIHLLIGELMMKNNREDVNPIQYGYICPLTDDKSEINLCINYKGCVLPCQLLYSDEYILGNINDHDLLHIFKNEKYKTILNNIKSASKEKLANCNQCICKSICRGGCRGKAFHLGNFYGTDGGCLFRKKQTNHLLYRYATNKKSIVS